MPYANYSEKLAAMRAYSKTPSGKAAKARSHARYTEKRRELARKTAPTIEAAPLAAALKNWRT